MSKWSIRFGPIRNQQDAEKKVEEYIAAHPGLRWLGDWETTVPDVMSVIQVCSVGEVVDVEIGPVYNQQDAERKAEFYMKSHPYLRWTGGWRTLDVANRRSSVLGMRVEEPRERQLCGTTGTTGSWFSVPICVRLRNRTKMKITHIDITGVDDYDWGDRQPTRFNGRSIAMEGELKEQLDVNYWCCSSPFEVEFTFANGSSMKCRLDGRVAIDCCRWNGWKTQWSCTPDTDQLAAFYITYAEANVDIVACDAADLQDMEMENRIVEGRGCVRSTTQSPSSNPSKQKVDSSSCGPFVIRMSRDGFEPKFWRMLIQLLTALNSPIIKPNALEEFDTQLADNSRRQQWDRIFCNWLDPRPLQYYDVVQALPDMLAPLYLILHQPSFIELIFYASRTYLERIDDLQPGSRSYEGHLYVVHIWQNSLFLLLGRLITILILDAVITVVALFAIIAAATAAIEGVATLEVAAAEAESEAGSIETLLAQGELCLETILRLLQYLWYILQMSQKFLPP